MGKSRKFAKKIQLFCPEVKELGFRIVKVTQLESADRGDHFRLIFDGVEGVARRRGAKNVCDRETWQPAREVRPLPEPAGE